MGDEATALWRRLDRPGHEFARLTSDGACRRIDGTSVFVHDQMACRLEYHVLCTPSWETVSAAVSGSVGTREVRLEIVVDVGRRWRVNGEECAEAAGCVDVDLGFTPATNLLPIRRLGLEVGREAALRAAWVGFPSLSVEPLDQLYRRTGPTLYRFESGGGAFVRDLEVDPAGFVTRYPGFWELEVSR